MNRDTGWSQRLLDKRFNRPRPTQRPITPKQQLSAKELAELDELLQDAEACPRLTDWEKEFVRTLRERRAAEGDSMALSEKQLGIVGRIRDQKVYP